ncbi:MAG: YqjF family protein [Rhodoglobus sp.]
MIEPEAISVGPPELRGRVVASQRWTRLTFVHWRVDSAQVAPLLPAGVRPDEHDGSSWVGLIGFHLGDATLIGSPPFPYFGDFAEINVRLYGVDDRGRRGVVFASLEASRLVAVLAARAAFSIPYFWSTTSIEEAAGVVKYLARRHRGAGETHIVARASTDPVTGDATADFLTARWGLFTSRFGRTIFLPNTHERWELYRAELIKIDDTLVHHAGLPGVVERVPDSVLYSPGVTARFGRALR